MNNSKNIYNLLFLIFIISSGLLFYIFSSNPRMDSDTPNSTSSPIVEYVEDEPNRIPPQHRNEIIDAAIAAAAETDFLDIAEDASDAEMTHAMENLASIDRGSFRVSLKDTAAKDIKDISKFKFNLLSVEYPGYATNRTYQSGKFTNRLSTNISYGFCEVSFPNIHITGNLERPGTRWLIIKEDENEINMLFCTR